MSGASGSMERETIMQPSRAGGNPAAPVVDDPFASASPSPRKNMGDEKNTGHEAPLAAPVAPAAKVNPLDLSPSDYNGTWDDGEGTLINLVVKQRDPLNAKVTGTISSPLIVGGSTKFKGKVFKGVDLIGKFRAKTTQGPFTVKLKVEMIVQLTDSTHFEGDYTGSFNGIPQSTFPITGTKV